MSPAFYIAMPIFLFALGACIGSFLNVVVWRLPRGESLVTPPSHCPKCNTFLKWYDNLPVIGWVFLGGKCRYCRQPISARYPIIEAITGLILLGYYLLFFVGQLGPIVGVDPEGQVIHGRALSILTDWPIYGLDMLLLSGLLAASLIDAELFIIPIEIPWVIVAIAIVVHAVFDSPATPGGLVVGPAPAALALGAAVGTLVSFVLWATGRLRPSFAEGAPMMEVEREKYEKERAGKQGPEASQKQNLQYATAATDAEAKEWSAAEVRREMRWEMLFLMPALALGAVAVLLVWKVPAIGRAWEGIVAHQWIAALLGSVLGGLVGGFTVWLTRILGTIAFGREAMGLGDVHLMVAVGAVLGAGPAVAAFFLAPFFGIVLAIYMLATGTRRELPYGPYLSLASAFVMLFYAQIAAWLGPGFAGGMQMLRSWMTGG